MTQIVESQGPDSSARERRLEPLSHLRRVVGTAGDRMRKDEIVVIVGDGDLEVAFELVGKSVGHGHSPTRTAALWGRELTAGVAAPNANHSRAPINVPVTERDQLPLSHTRAVYGRFKETRPIGFEPMTFGFVDAGLRLENAQKRADATGMRPACSATVDDVAGSTQLIRNTGHSAATSPAAPSGQLAPNRKHDSLTPEGERRPTDRMPVRRGPGGTGPCSRVRAHSGRP